MLDVLANRTYRYLFFAQCVALTGTGLATVALGLLAYDLAGEGAGLVLGTALTIKMLAYVFISPIATAFASQMPRRTVLIALDLVRMCVVLCLPFVSDVWQIYVLIFLLQSASAGFTPAFQATIPDVLPDERDFTKALTLSRLAYDTESLLSPVLAALLLTLVSFEQLFWGTALGFLASAAFITCVVLPMPTVQASQGIWERTTHGLRLYLRTPRLRGLLALNWVVAATAAMALVNTVVLVQGSFGLSGASVAFALAAFGGGSMAMAILLPRIIERVGDRRMMIAGAGLNTATIGSLAILAQRDLLGYAGLLVCWGLIGIGNSAMLTPAGRLLARSGQTEDRPALFAAQFTLSHACWLVFYPLAGWLMTRFGAPTSFWVLFATAVPAVFLATVMWPQEDQATRAPAASK